MDVFVATESYCNFSPTDPSLTQLSLMKVVEQNLPLNNLPETLQQAAVYVPRSSSG